MVGTVRMYHGGTAYQGGSRFLTPSLSYAQGYAAKNVHGSAAFVHYIDLPENSPYLVEASVVPAGYAKDYAPVNVPEHIARQLRPLTASTPPPGATPPPPPPQGKVVSSVPKARAKSSSSTSTSSPRVGKLADKLLKMVKSTEGNPRVSVGFLAGATYPDGTPVATIAAIQEFGSGNIPARPFFRLMVAEKSRDWGDAVRKNMKATNYDAHKTLEIMGQGIKAQLQDSIKTTMDPPNAPATIKKKGFDNPLIDTGHMMASVDYRVED